MAHPFRRGRLALVLLCATALAACDAVGPSDGGGDDDLVRRPSVLALDGDSARLGLPDTVAVGASVVATVRSYGGGCIRAGETEVAVDGLAADVRPFDYFPVPSPTRVCTADLRIIEHPATLRFARAGRAVVRVHGRRDGGDTPLVVQRTLVVR
jgi:hypothetical protein